MTSFVTLSKSRPKGQPRKEVLLPLTREGKMPKRRRPVEMKSAYLTPAKRELLVAKTEPCVKIGKSTIPGAGKGVFAKCDLPRGFQMPYMGKTFKGSFDQITRLIRGDSKTTDLLLYIFHDEASRTVIDGHPRFNQSISNVAFRVNEPPKGSRANCTFENSKGWAKWFSPISVVTRRRVKEGDELFVDYGEVYDRSHYGV